MIDWDRVKTLRQEVGDDAFDEVISLFVEEVDEVVARLQDSPDPSRFEQDLHFLKGSALNLGFAELGDLCQDAERLAASGRPGKIDLAAIIACYGRSRGAFLDRLGGGMRAAG
jgi:HPt (histidine-containing phosphotransfer) domain-containing protein